MAYQTGTVANSTALKTIIESFISANGWTASTGGLIPISNTSWYSNAESSIKLNNTLNTYGLLVQNSAYANGTIGTINFPITHNLVSGNSIIIIDSNVANLVGTFVVTVVNTTQVTFTIPFLSNAYVYTTPNTTNYVTPPENNTLTVHASTATGGTGTLSRRSGITIPTNSWPATYHLFSSDSPANIVCALNYDTLYMQYLMFGNIVKVHNNAYVGGNYVYGTRGASSYGAFMNGYLNLDSISDTTIQASHDYYWTSAGQVVPFGGQFQAVYSGQGCFIHAEIDNYIWPEPLAGVNSGAKLTIQTISQLFRSPNSWNSQAQLVVMHLHSNGASSLYHYLGYIEHVRLLRIDNYNLGDIITIGSDKWKVFPCHKKDTVNRNGTNTSSTLTTPMASGTIGLAIRYDGP